MLENWHVRRREALVERTFKIPAEQFRQISLKRFQAIF